MAAFPRGKGSQILGRCAHYPWVAGAMRKSWQQVPARVPTLSACVKSLFLQGTGVEDFT